jgi:hypothetical protein
MAHSRLSPPAGMNFLTPMEAIHRLAAEFPTLHTDREQGAKYVGRMLEQLRKMSHLVPPPASVQEIAQLESLTDQAIWISISDPADSSAALAGCLIPGQPLFFGYASAKHEQEAKPLLARCGAALGYVIEGE